MRIALVSQYFWPETFSINDIVLELEQQGHIVEVFTGKPNYPDGNVFPGYTEAASQTQRYGQNITVHRAPLRARRTGGAKNLLLNYFSFVFNGLRYFPRQMQGKEFDVIFVFTLSPITSVIPAIYLKWKFKKHLAIWVLDLWPDSLAATGFIKNKIILKLVGLLVKLIYSCADTILVQSKSFVEEVAKYTKKDKVFYYANSHIDFPEIVTQSDVIPAAVIDSMTDKFNIVFTGNIGTAQSIESLVEAAKKLKNNLNIQFVLVGSGSMSTWLAEQKDVHGLTNIVIAGRYPSTEMGHFLNKASVLLVSLKRAPIFSLTVPAKIQSYLAAAKPIIAFLDGEGARVVEEAGAGVGVPAESADELVAAILHMAALSNEQLDEMGQKGRRYFLENFETKVQVTRLVNLLENRLNK